MINDPERSEYFKQFPPNGIRTNFFFIADISKTSISNINAGGNGACLKSRNTNKFYYCDNDRTSIIRKAISGKFYYNERLCRNCYKKVYILSDKIVKLSLTYAKTKSFPLTRTDKTYQIQQVALLVPLLQFSTKRQHIAEKGEVPCHTNASQNSKPCFRTSKDVLYKAKEKYVDGLKDKAVYEEINKKSGETYYSSSKSGELGDTRKITGKKKRRKRAKERAHRNFQENSQRG